MTFGDEVLVVSPVVGKRLDFGQAKNDFGDVGAEFFADFFFGDVTVLDGVVQESGGNRRRTGLQSRKNIGDLDQMRDVGIARLAELTAVFLFGEAVRAFNQMNIIRIVNVIREFIFDVLIRVVHRLHLFFVLYVLVDQAVQIVLF